MISTPHRLRLLTVCAFIALALNGCGPEAGMNDGGGIDDRSAADSGAGTDVTTPPMDGSMGLPDVVQPIDRPVPADTAMPRDVVTPPADTATPRDVVMPPADTGTGVDAGGPPGNPTLENEILAIVNRNRAMGWSCGGTAYPAVGPLVMNPLLQLAARRHSLDMATRNFFAHNTPEGTTPFQRVAATGYTGSPVGENIAAGNATAAATMTQWMNSPGHCRNIMNGSYRSIGVGYAYNASSMYRHYWTQNFGGR